MYQMELTKDYLLEHGFNSNHPERVLCNIYKYHKEKPEWRINISQEFIPLSNKLSFNIDCWRCGNNGAIIKRASLHMVNTVEELNAIVDLCGINIDEC